MTQTTPSRSFIPWLALSLPLASLAALIVHAQLDPIGTWLVENEEMAGWTQALGALAALGATAHIAGIEGRRSRRALEAQAALQREIFEHQVRRDLEAQTARRNAALSAVKAAFLLYEMAIAVLARSEKKPYASFKAAYEYDFAIAKKTISNISYEHLIDEADMLLVSTMGAMFGDVDRSLDHIINRKDNDLHTEHFYMYICKTKMRTAREILNRMGANLTAHPSRPEMELTREERLASENADGSEWGADGSTIPDRQPREATPNLL